MTTAYEALIRPMKPHQDAPAFGRWAPFALAYADLERGVGDALTRGATAFGFPDTEPGRRAVQTLPPDVPKGHTLDAPGGPAGLRCVIDGADNACVDVVPYLHTGAQTACRLIAAHLAPNGLQAVLELDAGGLTLFAHDASWLHLRAHYRPGMAAEFLLSVHGINLIRWPDASRRDDPRQPITRAGDILELANFDGRILSEKPMAPFFGRAPTRYRLATLRPGREPLEIDLIAIPETQLSPQIGRPAPITTGDTLHASGFLQAHFWRPLA